MSEQYILMDSRPDIKLLDIEFVTKSTTPNDFEILKNIIEKRRETAKIGSEFYIAKIPFYITSVTFKVELNIERMSVVHPSYVEQLKEYFQNNDLTDNSNIGVLLDEGIHYLTITFIENGFVN